MLDAVSRRGTRGVKSSKEGSSLSLSSESSMLRPRPMRRWNERCLCRAAVSSESESSHSVVTWKGGALEVKSDGICAVR